MSQMESHQGKSGYGPVVHKVSAQGAPSIVVVCEHASNRVPGFLDNMGLSRDALRTHIAWDPGALSVARGIAGSMCASLVFGGVSRLVYDCNRPPDADDAMPSQSEDITIPANARMTQKEKSNRVTEVYHPFFSVLSNEIAKNRETLELMVTIHSFTPVFRGKTRTVELGLLHGKDARFAEAMLATRPVPQPYTIRLNEPYSAADGVAHTLDVHAVQNDLLNVMIEIRNDLIETPQQQKTMVDWLTPWIGQTLAGLNERRSA
ncbi:N-formylglutamate amidohydrolase [Ruegeria arenilitoris]|uniref:N-formylglutamate amidohydrolase n=1 Tax=Ruegeria arenilitoris TaxID=1173585 RepID=UPI00147DC852|nr:N-formylglutamate amidohydrolase [Ruegeria arenilitoris]